MARYSPAQFLWLRKNFQNFFKHSISHSLNLLFMSGKNDKFCFSADKPGGGRIGLNFGASTFEPVGDAVESNGKKTQKFKKEMLSVGHYIHPVWGWHLDITEDRLNRLAAVFNEMQKNGVAVEVPTDHSLSAKDNYGYVTEVSVEKNKAGIPALYGIHEMIGDEGISLAMRNKGVSVMIEKDFKDGKGNAYGEAITHSSIVQQPVVPGQEDFEAIAASIANKSDFPILFLSGKDNGMNEEMLKKLREILGADDSLTAENALSRIEDHIKGLGTKSGDLQKQLVDLQAKVTELEKGKAASTVTVDPNLAEQMGTTAEQQLDLLVAGGKITPAVKDKLAASLIGKTGSRNTIALSIGSGGTPSVFTKVIDALKDNDPVKLGEQSKAQMLSRVVPGDKTEVAIDPEVTKAMSAGAGVQAK